MIGRAFDHVLYLLSAGISLILNLLTLLFGRLFDGLKDLLVWLFTPILQLIGTIFYFLYKLGALILAVIDLVFKLVFFFAYVIKGLFVTLMGLNYNGAAARIPGRYQEVFDNMAPALSFLQINKIAVLCLWIVWVFVAISVVKIIGARGD